MTTVDLTNPIFTDPDVARKHFEAIRWPDGPYCPYCGQTDTVKPLGGKSMGPGWYHCKDCRRKFTAQVGTIYERSHILTGGPRPSCRAIPKRRSAARPRSTTSPPGATGTR